MSGLCENNCGQPTTADDFAGEFCSLKCYFEWTSYLDDLRAFEEARSDHEMAAFG